VSKYNKSIYGKIKIKDDVWLRYGGKVLKGCIINKRSIIAEGAVVNKDVMANSIYSGIPAKLIKKLND
jgi:acetyltransferase-like isoleucine patch superfamily enzyme